MKKRIFCLFLTTILALLPLTVFSPSQNANAETIYSCDTFGPNVLESFNSGIMPMGGYPIGIINETINYSYKTIDKYFNPYELPTYLSSYTCGITAGSVALGFYDRQYEELIPNHTGTSFLGLWFYGTPGTEVWSMQDKLYTMMGATPEGVTNSGFRNGMTTYASSRGRNMSFTKAMSGSNSINLSSIQTAFNSDKTVAIFLSNFNIVEFTDVISGSGYDTIKIYTSGGAHIMIAYGYMTISYYNTANQLIRKDNYLYVSTGYSIPTLSWIRLGQYGNLDDAYIMNVS